MYVTPHAFLGIWIYMKYIWCSYSSQILTFDASVLMMHFKFNPFYSIDITYIANTIMLKPLLVMISGNDIVAGFN